MTDFLNLVILTEGTNMKYKVGNTEFETFEEIEAWAWNTHKICFDGELVTHNMSESMKQDACDELNTILSAPSEEDEDPLFI